MVPSSGLAERVPEQTEAVLVTQSDPPRSARLGPPSHQVTSNASTRSRHWSRSGLTPDARAPASGPLTRSPRSPISSRWPAMCAVVPAESADELDDHLAIVVDVNAEPSLAVRGRTFWRSTVASFELSDVELELLRECCRLLDECESLGTAVDTEGITVVGSTGQTRVHPALGELRQHRLALGKLLAQLSLPDVDDESLLSPTQARGRRAAQSRWGRVEERRVRYGVEGPRSNHRLPRAGSFCRVTWWSRSRTTATRTPEQTASSTASGISGCEREG